MDIHVVNLRRRNDRREQFLAWNDRSDLSFSFFEAVEGSQELRANLIAQGSLSDSANWFTLGALGCAMSHRALWEQCIRTGTNSLIVEDDACLRSDFSEALNPVIAAAGNDWDMLYLGYNTNAMIAVVVEDGSITAFAYDDSAKKENGFFEVFSRSEQRDGPPTVARCYQIWGTLAYLVTPEGAANLCRCCFPLDSNKAVEMLGQGRAVPATGIDGMINFGLQRENIRAFCCIPPLVLGPNDQSDSDVAATKAAP